MRGREERRKVTQAEYTTKDSEKKQLLNAQDSEVNTKE